MRRLALCCLLLPSCLRLSLTVPNNQAPRIRVDPANQQVRAGSTVTLHAEASDEDGDPVTIRWTQVEGSGDPVTLTNGESADAEFVAPDLGQRLFFRVVASDGAMESTAGIATVRINGRPQVEVGPPTTVVAGAPLLLTAAASDPDGDPIVSYRWRVIAAPSVASTCTGATQTCLEGEDVPTAIFTPPVKGDYTLGLIVSDGDEESVEDTLFVRATNRPPLAVATTTTSRVSNGAIVTVDGSASTDPDGDMIASYQWSLESLPAGATATFSPANGNIAAPTITLEGKGTYFLALVVHDAFGEASPKAILRLDAINNSPTADAGADRVVPTGIESSLLGTGTDPDGDTLSYRWTLVDAPPGGLVTLGDAGSQAARLTPSKKSLVSNPALCTPGSCYVAELSVSDGISTSVADRVTLVSGNRAPIANAGPDKQNPSSPVALDGSPSFDPDDDTIVSYTWTQVSGPDVTSGMGSLSGITPSFAYTTVGTYSFELTVSDGTSTSAIDRVNIFISAINQAPTLVLGSTVATANEGTAFLGLDASQSTDPEGDPITITWTRRVGSPTAFPAVLSGSKPTPTAPAFAALLAAGTTNAIYDVVASDGLHTSPSQAVTLFTLPGNGYVIVGSTPASSDAGLPICGTTQLPCRTIGKALALVDADNNGSGDGRVILLTTGAFSTDNIGNGPVLTWKSGTSAYGGFDPITFEIVGHSQLNTNSNGCFNPRQGFAFGSGSGIEIARIDITHVVNGCENIDTAVVCTNCGVTFRDLTMTSVTLGTAVRGAIVTGAGANVLFDRVIINGGGAGAQSNTGIDISAGATVTLRDSSVITSGQNPTIPSAQTQAAVNVDSSTFIAQRSRFVLKGSAVSASPVATIVATNSSVSVTSSFLSNVIGVLGDGVAITGGAATLINNTIVGSDVATGTASGVRSTVAVSMMNNIILGFPRAITYGAVAGLSSLVFGNALSSTVQIGDCNGTPAVLADFNAATSTSCNTSGTTLASNIGTACPLIGRASFDLHLNTGVANACDGGGLSASAAGAAPAQDVDKNVFAAPPSIGADEP